MIFLTISSRQSAKRMRSTASPISNPYRMALKSEFADDHSLATMSDAAEFIAANAGEASICAASEFIARDDGLPGLEAAYDTEFTPVVELDLNLIYTQVGESCNFG